MTTIEKLALAVISVVTLGACYTAGVLIGWVMAILSTIAIVATIVLGVLYLLAYCIWELFFDWKNPNKK